MAAPKLTKTQQEEVMAAIAQFDRRGYDQRRIVKALREKGIAQLSQPAVLYYLKKIREEYRDVTRAERQTMIREKIEALNEVIATAWEGYDKSCKDGQKRVTEKVRPPAEPVAPEEPKNGKRVRQRSPEAEVKETLQRIKVIMTREGRIPANEFLQTIIKATELQCKLLGLLEPDKTVNNGTQVFINWDAMLNPTPITDPMDEITANLVTPALPSSNGDSHA